MSEPKNRTPSQPDADDSLTTVIARHNLAVLTSFMQIAGLYGIEVDISGHEGNVTVNSSSYLLAAEAMPTDRPPPLTVSGLQELAQGREGEWKRTPMRALTFDEALERTLDDVLDSCHPGWSEDFGGEAVIGVRANEADIHFHWPELQWNTEWLKQTPQLSPLTADELGRESYETGHERLAHEGLRHNIACLTEAMQDAGLHLVTVAMDSHDPAERVHLLNMATVSAPGAGAAGAADVDLDAVTVRGMVAAVGLERRDVGDISFRQALDRVATHLLRRHFPRWNEGIDAEARIVFSASDGVTLEVNEEVRQKLQFRAMDRPVRIPDEPPRLADDNTPAPG